MKLEKKGLTMPAQLDSVAVNTVGQSADTSKRTKTGASGSKERDALRKLVAQKLSGKMSTCHITQVAKNHTD